MAVISMPVIATCLVFMASTCNTELVEISADEPELVGRVLTSLRLGAADLARLDADERAEMMDAMCAAEVTLGDRHRFRLRLGGARAPSQRCRQQPSESRTTRMAVAHRVEIRPEQRATLRFWHDAVVRSEELSRRAR